MAKILLKVTFMTVKVYIKKSQQTWRDGLVVMIICYSCRGPRFSHDAQTDIYLGKTLTHKLKLINLSFKNGLELKAQQLIPFVAPVDGSGLIFSTHMEVHNYPFFQFQVYQSSFLALQGLRTHMIYIYTPRQNTDRSNKIA